MLKTIMLRREIDRKKNKLEELRAKDADFEKRESELAGDIEDVSTDEEKDAVTAEVDQFDADRAAHDQAKAALESEIADLENQLGELERSSEPKTESRSKDKTERRTINVKHSINIRKLPENQYAFDALPMEERTAIVAQQDVQDFLQRMRSMKGQTRAVTGAELTIPVVFLDLIAENMYRYSKLLNRVRVRNVRGQARQTIAGTVPEAVWTEMCGRLNELEFVFNQVELDGYKVGGFVPICNQVLEDSDIALASWIIEMISESLGLAKDKAILYGTGNKMPLGIATRLAQTAQPAGYPAAAPAWVDLHTTNIISIAANLTGAAFWSALQIAVGNTFTRYNRGTTSWAMNSKTYALLKSKAITFTASGDVVANVYGILPIVSGDIDILEFMPDGDIIGGYGDLYLWAQRGTMTIGMDDVGYTNRVNDTTLFFGREVADGQPAVPGAFVAININGTTPVTSVVFPSDKANTVAGVLLPAAASVGVGQTLQLGAVLVPFGVKGTITYSSGTVANATVDANGVVTGVKAGSSVITATCEGFTAACTVTVA